MTRQTGGGREIGSDPSRSEKTTASLPEQLDDSSEEVERVVCHTNVNIREANVTGHTTSSPESRQEPNVALPLSEPYSCTGQESLKKKKENTRQDENAVFHAQYSTLRSQKGVIIPQTDHLSCSKEESLSKKKDRMSQHGNADQQAQTSTDNLQCQKESTKQTDTISSSTEESVPEREDTSQHENTDHQAETHTDNSQHQVELNVDIRQENLVNQTTSYSGSLQQLHDTIPESEPTSCTGQESLKKKNENACQDENAVAQPQCSTLQIQNGVIAQTDRPSGSKEESLNEKKDQMSQHGNPDHQFQTSTNNLQCQNGPNTQTDPISCSTEELLAETEDMSQHENLDHQAETSTDNSQNQIESDVDVGQKNVADHTSSYSERLHQLLKALPESELISYPRQYSSNEKEDNTRQHENADAQAQYSSLQFQKEVSPHANPTSCSREESWSNEKDQMSQHGNPDHQFQTSTNNLQCQKGPTTQTDTIARSTEESVEETEDTSQHENLEHQAETSTGNTQLQVESDVDMRQENVADQTTTYSESLEQPNDVIPDTNSCAGQDSVIKKQDNTWQHENAVAQAQYSSLQFQNGVIPKTDHLSCIREEPSNREKDQISMQEKADQQAQTSTDNLQCQKGPITQMDTISHITEKSVAEKEDSKSQHENPHHQAESSSEKSQHQNEPIPLTHSEVTNAGAKSSAQVKVLGNRKNNDVNSQDPLEIAEYTLEGSILKKVWGNLALLKEEPQSKWDEKKNCAICSFSSDTKVFLQRHLRGHLEPVEKGFKCPLCLYTSKGERHIRNHLSNCHHHESVLKVRQQDRPYTREVESTSQTEVTPKTEAMGNVHASPVSTPDFAGVSRQICL